MSNSSADQFRPLVGNTVCFYDGQYRVFGHAYERHDGLDAEHIRSNKITNVQDMALKLLGIVKQPSYLIGLARDFNTNSVFHSFEGNK